MKKENFTHWGFILAAAGSAVGLGNIWRFPYLCGQYGGLSFILVYLLVLFLICNPLMVSEIAIGRAAKSNFIDAYKILGERAGIKHTWPWSFCGGWLAFVGVTMIISFYFLVAGWVLYYFFEALSGKLMLITTENMTTEFENLTRNFSVQYSCGLIFLLVTALIVMSGVKQGIERTSMYLMPMLFLIFILLSIRAVTLEGAQGGIQYLLRLDPRYLGFTNEGFQWMTLFDTITAALGQAFISLSLGFGVLLVYGSYFSPKDNLFAAVRRIEIFDTMAALLSAVIIIPAVFAAGLPTDSGPGLTFISLPLVFKQLTGGWFWSICFYLLLMLATVTSTISVFEALVNLCMDKLKIKRPAACFCVLTLCISGFSAVTLSFSGVWTTKFFNRDLFSLFDFISSTFTTTIVSMTMALFVGYKAMKPIIHNIRRSAVVTTGFTRYFLLTLRIFAPIGMGLLLLLAFFR